MANTPVLLGPGPLTLTGPVPAISSGDSTAPGFIAPTSSPLYDNPLDDFLHGWIAGLSGLPGSLVRPRWQPEPPNMPDFNVNWVAWGILEVEEDRFAYQGQQDDATGVIERDEILLMLMSFYGPQAGQLAKRVSASLQLNQNRGYLRAQNMTVVEVMDHIRVPALVKELWVPRVDQRIRFRRRATWAYQIKTLEDFRAELDNERYITPMQITAD